MADNQEDVKGMPESPAGEPSIPEQTTGEESPNVHATLPDGIDEKIGKEPSETGESGKGANQRIRELNQRVKASEEKAKSLAERLAEVTQPTGLGQDKPAYKPQLEPGTEITPEQYQDDVAKTAQSRVDLAIAQNNAINRINNESSAVVVKYPQLDPESEHFDKELSDAVTEATEAQVRLNPYSASVIKIVDKLMKPYKGAVAKEVSQVSENIAKQASETALRPTSVRQPEKPAKEKSIAELEQELGVVNA